MSAKNWMNQLTPWHAAMETQLEMHRLVDKIINTRSAAASKLKLNFELDETMLRIAVPFGWTEETVSAVLSASQTIPKDAVLNVWNLNAAAGWWWFQRPLPVKTLSTKEVAEEIAKNKKMEGELQAGVPDVGEDVGVRALNFGWIARRSDGKPRFFVCCYADDPMNEFPSTPSQVWSWHEGETLEAMLTRIRGEYIKTYGPGGYLSDQQIRAVGIDAFMDAAEKIGRFILAGMAWITQKVVVLDVEKVNKKRTRAYEHGIGKSHAPRVIRLRVAESQPKGIHVIGEQREWQHRWVVGGHFRNQACGPKHADHRLIYIHPYLKGPDDKPLLERPIVYAVDRR